ncbi:MAG: metal-dependent hydrolase [Candidatus Omnitrophica bacterium]|nr:metal-dependent hydrolase [Candidatus Omnitrophota bacterium]
MRPLPHAITSFAASLVVYSWLDSLLAAIICFLGGTLIDLDHIPEYLSIKNREFSLKALYYSNIVKDKERIYIVFHSFELVFLLWLMILLFEFNLFWTAFAIGITMHLVFDLFRNPIASPGAYFFLYRLSRGFKGSLLFKIPKS